MKSYQQFSGSKLQTGDGWWRWGIRLSRAVLFGIVLAALLPMQAAESAARTEAAGIISEARNRGKDLTRHFDMLKFADEYLARKGVTNKAEVLREFEVELDNVVKEEGERAYQMRRKEAIDEELKRVSKQAGISVPETAATNRQYASPKVAAVPLGATGNDSHEQENGGANTVAEGSKTAGGKVGNAEYPRWFFHAGLTAANPYKLDGGKLDASSLNTHAFVEFVFNDHWAWQKSTNFPDGLNPDRWTWLTRDRSPLNFISSGWDLQTRFGYTFGDGSQTAPTAATFGAGDFHAEAVLGRSLVRYASSDLLWRMSMGPEVSAGVATDHPNFDVHPHVLAGLGWSAGGGSFDATTGELSPRFAYSLRAGYAWLDRPSLTMGSNGLTLATDANGLVKYDRLQGGLGVETELYYPVAKETYLTFGGRVYGLSGKNEWSFYIGAIKSIESLVGAFTGKQSP